MVTKNSWLVCLPVLLVACATEPPPLQRQVIDDLTADHPLPCVQYLEVSHLNTPPDIVSGARACVAEARYQQAAELLMVAGSFAYFDAQRVTDRTAHVAWGILLAESFADLPRSDKVELFARLGELNQSAAKAASVCAYLRSLQPPGYVPEYMLSHRLDPQTSEPGSDSTGSFLPQASWKAARAYVNCSG